MGTATQGGKATAPFTLDPSLWAPQKRCVEQVMEHVRSGKDVCLQSPTGSGKTKMASELLRWSAAELGGGAFYVNRKLLVSQTADRFDASGLPCGVRAADHEDRYDASAPIQVCSANTENARVYGAKAIWNPHHCGLVVVDEAHIQKGKMMKKILEDHRRRGAKVVLLSATPVALSKMADKIVIGGTMKEFRDCGALVPAVVKSIEQPDLRKVKRTATGEYDMDGKKRRSYTQSIVGSVIDSWRAYNPDARPTMLYAPGVDESVWFTKQFEKAGVRWAHVDANDAVIDGNRQKLTRSLWEDIVGQYVDGSIKGICSRMKLREGVDVTSTYQIILATPIGSLQSYLQTVGRGLRASPDAKYAKDHCLVTDHGGNYLRHGSPNRDRPWEVIWRMSSNTASKLHENQIRNQETPEPIRCPQCKGERLGGVTCPHCGHCHQKSQREVIQEDGRLVSVEGSLIKIPHRTTRSTTQAMWDKMFWGYKNKGLKLTFAQMEAFFQRTHGYLPERNLNNMPTETVNWHRHVKDVPFTDLRVENRR